MAERIEKLQSDLKMIGRLSPFGAIHYIRNIVGYEEYLREYAEYRNRKAEDLLEILDELQALSKGFQTFGEWSAHIEEYKKELERQAKAQERESNSVSVATMHSSKGLEYRIVFIPDANEGVTPHKRAVLDEDVEEERRLFYVAMTRAKELLYVFSVKKMYNRKGERSRILEELLE